MRSYVSFAIFIVINLEYKYIKTKGIDTGYNGTTDKDQIQGIRINIGVLLPLNDVPHSQEPCFSINHLLPTAQWAVTKIKKFWDFPESPISRIRVWFVDSNCSDTYGPLNAMRLLFDMEVHAFFGPCCKYVLSPVARYAKVWRTPIISPGGLTPAFSNKQNFPLLTRIMAPYDKLAEFVVSAFNKFELTKYSILWHDHHLRKHLGKSECYQMADALIRKSRSQAWLSDPHKETFDEGYLDMFDWNNMLGGIRNNSRGESMIFYFPLGQVQKMAPKLEIRSRRKNYVFPLTENTRLCKFW